MHTRLFASLHQYIHSITSHGSLMSRSRHCVQGYLSDPAAQQVLQAFPHCHDILPSFWLAQYAHEPSSGQSQGPSASRTEWPRERAPPVWVDVAVSVQPMTTTTTVSPSRSVSVSVPVSSPGSSGSPGARLLRGEAGQEPEPEPGTGVLAMLRRLTTAASTGVSVSSSRGAHWLLSLLVGTAPGGRDRAEYSHCLNRYAEMRASSGSGRDTSSEAGNKQHTTHTSSTVEAMKQRSVLYSTHKATPASEVLCW